MKISLKKRTFVSDLKDIGYETYAISANPYVHPVYGFDEFDNFKEESYFTDMWGSVIEISDKLKPMFAKYREKYGNDLVSSMVKIPLATLAEDPGLFFEGVASGLVLTPISAARKLKAKLVDDWPLEKGGKRIVKMVKDMKPKRPFFLFLNFMEAHDPYTESKKTAMSWVTPFLKEKTDPNVIELWKRLYLKASKKGYAYAYSVIEDLLARFGNDQIIILTADHGQEFNEQGFIGHGTVLDDEVIKVPMVVMLPKGFKSKQGKGYSSLVNVRDLLSAVLEENKDALDALFSKVVHAESFGVPANISKAKGIDLKKLAAKEKVTKRSFR